MAKNESIKYENQIFGEKFDMTDEAQAKVFWFTIEMLCKIEVESGRDWNKFVAENVVFGA